jgi:hypothetical protein
VPGTDFVVPDRPAGRMIARVAVAETGKDQVLTMST